MERLRLPGRDARPLRHRGVLGHGGRARGLPHALPDAAPAARRPHLPHRALPEGDLRAHRRLCSGSGGHPERRGPHDGLDLPVLDHHRPHHRPLGDGLLALRPPAEPLRERLPGDAVALRPHGRAGPHGVPGGPDVSPAHGRLPHQLRRLCQLRAHRPPHWPRLRERLREEPAEAGRGARRGRGEAAVPEGEVRGALRQDRAQRKGRGHRRRCQEHPALDQRPLHPGGRQLCVP
mmetsp:Transcript_33413/g.105899  ORF Transcript_33413/g.105899 Transcript_33413/m.105899 type:complete len:234 (+) Transcript_33413:342-1043(+)